jgi:2-keto-4-pentenoate hydratase/2-oxohepta-3-ene-1,7-dioic acid hydratase in catechol pathway
MRFVSFSTTELPKPHLGIVRDDEVLDVDLAGQALKVMVPDQMQDLIEHYDEYHAALHTILDKAAGRRFTEVKTYAAIGAARDLTNAQLAAPLVRPRKNIMCVALNYSEHAKETATARQRSADAPTIPVFFTKAPTTVNSPYGKIEIDAAVSSEIDWEAELGVIIGRSGKNIQEADALSYVFGYTVLNDVTARDLQSRHKQFFKGKSLDGSCPMGPWIVTTDELSDPHNLALSLRVNGVTKQHGTTSDMVFSIARLIATLSSGMTLEPGDIIATGTPSGVGFSRTPPEFLRPGDIMETEIEKIGVLRNPVVGK